MSEIIGNYRVFSSNASSKQRASVTVRQQDGAIVARVYSAKSQPLRFLRNWINCEERLELVDQLRGNGVPPDVIKDIISLKDY
jgi:hypothetical protein